MLRWALWSASLGIIAGTAVVLLYPLFPGPVFRMMWLDHLAMIAAGGATSFVFPGERIAYPGLSEATFFNTVFVLVTGLQAGLLGAVARLISAAKSKMRPTVAPSGQQ